MLQDIAILTKGIVISEEQGFKLENADLALVEKLALELSAKYKQN
jgi:chaperonin GroEL